MLGWGLLKVVKFVGLGPRGKEPRKKSLDATPTCC